MLRGASHNVLSNAARVLRLAYPFISSSIQRTNSPDPFNAKPDEKAKMGSNTWNVHGRGVRRLPSKRETKMAAPNLGGALRPQIYNMLRPRGPIILQVLAEPVNFFAFLRL